jgi:hypothetical protein
MNGAAAQKLLERMRSSPSGWGQADFERLFSGFGFKWREGKKHRIYFHPKFSNLWISVPGHDSLRSWVGREAVKLIDDLMILSNPSEESNESSNQGT